MEKKQLEVIQEFTDKSGVKHKKGDRITVEDSEAQEYVSRGQAKEAGGQQGQQQQQQQKP